MDHRGEPPAQHNGPQRRELGRSVLEASRATGVTAGPISRSIRRVEVLASQLGVQLPAVPQQQR
jgi:hypothetical protein